MREPSKPLSQNPAAITARREEAGLTKYRLAKILGYRSRSVFTEIEKGTRNAAPDLLERMAAVFGCPVAELQASPPATATDVDMQLRGTERVVSHDVPELRR